MLFAIILAELFSVVLVLGSSASFNGFLQALAIKSMLVQWIVILSLAGLCLSNKQLNRLSPARAYVAAASLLILSSIIVVLSIFLLPQDIQNALQLPLFQNLLLSVVSITTIVSFVIMRYLYVQGQWRFREQAESEARLQALQSRIRPHFLFNSMNTIAALTRSNPELAEQTVLDLADLFRASLASSSRTATLASELELARGYLRIEEQRLGERLSINWDIEKLPQNIQMPALILQPLLENSVYHGIEPTTNGGEINITIRYRRRHVNISIVNPLPKNKTQRQGNQMAMDNVRQRLDGFFGGEAKLRSGMVDGAYQLRLVFPHPWTV